LKKKKTEKKKKEKKPEPKSDSIFTKKSEAGKGDSPRMGISYDEWEKKYEKIFGRKEEFVRPHKSNNNNTKS
jgi:hypothetical protein